MALQGHVVLCMTEPDFWGNKLPKRWGKWANKGPK